MKQLYLRIPDELHEQLVKLAERERRSLNAQIIYLLEQDIQRIPQAPKRAQEDEEGQ
jgi:hypothetical protein